jgi:glucokinase
MASPPFYVGVDVGGTTIKAGTVDDAGQALSAVSLPTEAFKGQEHGLRTICEAVGQAVSRANLSMDRVAAIGVATPGTMDIPAGIILEPPNLKPWKNVPVKQYVYEQFGKPTAFQNDANAAAYGEFWVGAGKGTQSLVMFTLGTGIGCGIIINDMVLEGRHSHGAEVGHVKIEMTNPLQCGCGRWGCLEAYASATAVVRRTLESLKTDGGSSSLHAILGANKELTAEAVFDAWAEGDKLSRKIVEETAFYLAVGVTNMMHTIDPDMVVFGGGMTASGEPFLAQIREHIQRLAFPVPAAKTHICYAKLGTDAGFIGAAACGRKVARMS